MEILASKQVQPNLNEQVLLKYTNAQPQQWGEKVSGVAHSLDTKQKILALTFDACGGSVRSNGYDANLIDYLDKMQIPATLFISGKWIDANPDIFLKLAHNKLFEIGNHGLNHLPCSVNGKTAYNIKGTSTVADVIEEIETNGEKILSRTELKPRFYRSGTNYYDEAAVALASDLGYTTVGYSVLGDAGATYNREQVKKALLGARAGSIVIFHFNHPEGETAEGIMDAIPILEKNGFRFVKLSDYPIITYP
ncbi:MAG: polysaccharide deacetylase [Firmicutes bacterium HGW-Firmicutes-15]|nr:MAG: polysaccharide deacetylase [Firmicutes bacterium HGW-Firmicutes-15]